MSSDTSKLRNVADSLVSATNAFDVDRALDLFTSDAVIDDPSTGHVFDGHAGVRDYIERYFVGYQTVTRVLSFTQPGKRKGRARVDFTGDFGHEIGILELTVNAKWKIVRVDAALE